MIALTRLRFVLLAAGLLAACASCDDKRREAAPAPLVVDAGAPGHAPAAASSSAAVAAFDPAQLNLFAPIAAGVDKPSMDDAAKLGRMLFFDRRLSRGHDVACASCHSPSKAGQDGEATAVGTKGQRSKRNTPTLLNTGGAFAQGWDARAPTVEDFVVPHLLDPSIMGMPDDKRVVATIESIPAYAAAFKNVFADEPSPITADTVARAIAAYTKKLFARSRWDRYLAGDRSLLTDAELGGVATFVEAGCTSCHQGKYIGATQAQKLGVARPWPAPAGQEPGRFEVTKQEVDRGTWKVPSLRNVTRTGPYLHDGSVRSLEEMVRLMARHQAGRELSDAQVTAIVAWLGTLTGDPPAELTASPALPPSGPRTPNAL